MAGRAFGCMLWISFIKALGSDGNGAEIGTTDAGADDTATCEESKQSVSSDHRHQQESMKPYQRGVNLHLGHRVHDLFWCGIYGRNGKSWSSSGRFAARVDGL